MPVRVRSLIFCAKKTTVQSVVFLIISWLGIKNDYRILIEAEKLDLLELCENDEEDDDGN